MILGTNGTALHIRFADSSVAGPACFVLLRQDFLPIISNASLSTISVSSIPQEVVLNFSTSERSKQKGLRYARESHIHKMSFEWREQ